MDDHSRPSGPPWLAVIALTLFAVITVLAATGALDRPDHALFDLCERHQRGSVAAFCRHLTDVLSPAVDVAVLAVGASALAWRRRRPRVYVVAALMACTMAGVVLVTKSALARPVPGVLAEPIHGGSYPSGHTAAFLVSFGTLALLVTTRHRRQRRPLLALVAVGTLVVAASLVYAGFHWLSDTLGSIALGSGLLALQRRYLSP